jgi:DNA-binding NarL/FixJ family response regulator
MTKPALQARPGDRPPIRIVLADDARPVRIAIHHLLAGVETMTIVGECNDVSGVSRALDRLHADLLVTDIRMPPTSHDDGIHLAAALRRTHPALGVIVLSTYPDVTYALKLFDESCDGRGYVLKDRIRDRAQFVAAIEAVADGGSWIDPQIVEDLVTSFGSAGQSDLEALTASELQTLALVAEGKSDAAIAESLLLTDPAVEQRVNAIFTKLDLGGPDQLQNRTRNRNRMKAVLVYLSERPGTTSTAYS